MQKLIGNSILSLSMRNGFGIDLEVVNSRPILIQKINSDDLEFAYFDGFVLLLPFIIVFFGEPYDTEDWRNIYS